GVAYASVNYSLMPRADIDGIVGQSKRAVSWLAEHASQLGIDRRRMLVSGHSAGAHLAAMCLNASSWLRGGWLGQRLFRLQPLRRASENAEFRFTPESVARNSPIRHLPHRGQSVLACYGEIETSEFKRQTHEYVEACTAAGVDARVMPLRGFNHFDVIH